MANNDNHPLTPRAKRLRISIWGALLAGFIIGIVTSIMQSGNATAGPASMFGQAISPTLALIIAVTAIVAIVPLTILYHKNADEHEERAVLWGSTIGAYVALGLAFVWAILFKGGWVPQPDLLAVMAAMCLTSFAVYAWVKYR